jgi:hypothetical protein
MGMATVAKSEIKRDEGAARRMALGARPHRLPAVRTEERDGKLYVTVRFLRPRWQRLLGADARAERTFGLDAYGRRVYESCDGRRTVGEVCAGFSAQTGISRPESEMAVTRFLRTLMIKGLVAMEMDRRSGSGMRVRNGAEHG